MTVRHETSILALLPAEADATFTAERIATDLVLPYLDTWYELQALVLNGRIKSRQDFYWLNRSIK